MKNKTDEKCLDAFDDYRCQRPKKYHGKHRDDSGNFLVMWTDGGKERVLREREREQEKKASTVPV
jgi:hypothetical protein